MKTLYYGGSIRTMAGNGRVEALLVEDGRVAAAGTWEQLRPLARGAETVNLDGRALLPAFLDAHSHFSGAAHVMLHADLTQATDFAVNARAFADFLAQN